MHESRSLRVDDELGKLTGLHFPSRSDGPEFPDVTSNATASLKDLSRGKISPDAIVVTAIIITISTPSIVTRVTARLTLHFCENQPHVRCSVNGA